MPIYEYKCQDCGGISEILTGVTGTNTAIVCKNCGSKNLTKLISVSFISSNTRPKGLTCCGREERCDTPPCSTGNGTCRRDIPL